MGSSVREYYRNKSILITGGTGFVGKVLCEKILRSCPHITNIYVLLRSRKERTAQQRLEEEILNSSAFTVNKDHKPEAIQKIIAINGDLSKPGLGLSSEDRQTLVNNVSLVFHVAAVVKFDEPLNKIVDQNVFGTDYLMKLCEEMTKLEALVYVSTAYSNCNLKEVEEKVYKLEESTSDTIRNIAQNNKFNYVLEASVAPILMEGRINSYTYSKAIAENLVIDKYSHLPVVVVRPSIVISSMREPAPGWVDNINGPIGAALLGGLGIARTTDIEPNARADIIPVDIVSNSLIVIGWHLATHKDQHKQVIHLTSGHHNPVTWERFMTFTLGGAKKYPSMKMIRPLTTISTIDRDSPIARINHFVTKLFSQILFAYLADILLTLLGRKRFMVKTISKMLRAFAVSEPFTTKDWHFHNDNYYEIYEKLSEEEKEVFFSDIRAINWKSYSEALSLGIRRYLLKESDATLEMAEKRMSRIYLIHGLFKTITMLIFMALIYYLIFF